MNSNPQQTRHSNRKLPIVRVRAVPFPGWLTLAQVAELLGIPVHRLQRSWTTDFGWLPIPTRVGRKHLYWPERETLTAISRGRTLYSAGWWSVPGIDPPVHVRVMRGGDRPAWVQLDELPEGSQVGEWLTEIEIAIHRHFGHRCYIDSPSPCVSGNYPLRRITGGEGANSPSICSGRW